ncbi:MAG: VWA domain-containing protein [Bacteroidales bacterium]|nr:VWA domain-containing protein [Bacteroidales bacterium]
MKRHLLIIAALLMTSTLMTSCFKEKVDTSEQGLYVGIIGFNSEITDNKLTLLNTSSKEDMKKFVNDLTMEDGTILYHAVNTALDKIEAVTPPEDLTNVSIITFTDGLDQGSYMLNDNYNSGDAYLNAVSNRIRNTSIGANQVPISAYSIGVKTEGINEVNFRQSLEKLSSNPHQNVYLVDNMIEVGQIFGDIAENLYQESSTWDVTLKTPAPEHHTRIRFTFDNVNNAAESERYIEGIFLNQQSGTCIFNGVNYVGLQNCGDIIYPTTEGIFVYFTFSNLFTLDGEQVYTSNTKQWNWDDNAQTWVNNAEFTPSGNVVTQVERKSAMIMLVLDCSSSLGNDFQSVKSAACQFIETLNGNTHQ